MTTPSPAAQAQSPGLAAPHAPSPAAASAPGTSIELAHVSRWYGNVVAVNDITMSIGPGVTGLLGPNGAGKSTILHMIAGFLAPSKGELTVAGKPSWRHPEVYTQLGLVPERDSVYAFLTGEQFVTASARLHKLPRPEQAPVISGPIVDEGVRAEPVPH